VTRDEGEPYSLVEDAGSWTIRHREDGIVQPLYAFTLRPRRLDEFEARCAFQQSSPESHFTRNTICSLATPFGRISLAGRKLIVTSHGHRDEREVRDAEEYCSILRTAFGIELSVDEAGRLIASAPPQTGPRELPK
jgi:N-hydroxyarylamine O-acetyltransferase